MDKKVYQKFSSHLTSRIYTRLLWGYRNRTMRGWVLAI